MCTLHITQFSGPSENMGKVGICPHQLITGALTLMHKRGGGVIYFPYLFWKCAAGPEFWLGQIMRIYQNRYEKMINDIKVGKIFKSSSFIYFVTKEFWNSNPSSKIFKHMVPQIENNSRIGRLAIKYCILSLSEVTKYVVNRHLVTNHIRFVLRGAS